MSKKRKSDASQTLSPPTKASLPITADSSAPPRLKKKAYRREMAGLQVRLVKLQEWAHAQNLRLVIVLEGLGPAGKRGVARCIDESLQKQACQVVTLEPTRRGERDQRHFQRYAEHFPAPGKLTVFDGSWYHGAAVKRALGLMDEAEFATFLQSCAEFERSLGSSSVYLIKYWFTADDGTQEERFRAHIEDLRKTKQLRLPEVLPATPLSVGEVREAILAATDGPAAPWHIIAANDKRRGRLLCLTHLLEQATAALKIAAL